MASSATVKKIIQSWISKGEKEQDPFNKFICNWIAFNCFYLSHYNVEYDRDAIGMLKGDYDLSKRFNEEINGTYETEKNTLIKVCPIDNVQKDSRYFISKNFPFCEVIEVLYQIRCNLFHGHKVEEEKRDMDVVKAANPILSILVNICKIIYERNN